MVYFSLCHSHRIMFLFWGPAWKPIFSRKVNCIFQYISGKILRMCPPCHASCVHLPLRSRIDLEGMSGISWASLGLVAQWNFMLSNPCNRMLHNSIQYMAQKKEKDWLMPIDASYFWGPMPSAMSLISHDHERTHEPTAPRCSTISVNYESPSPWVYGAPVANQ